MSSVFDLCMHLAWLCTVLVDLDNPSAALDTASVIRRVFTSTPIVPRGTASDRASAPLQNSPLDRASKEPSRIDKERWNRFIPPRSHIIPASSHCPTTLEPSSSVEVVIARIESVSTSVLSSPPLPQPARLFTLHSPCHPQLSHLHNSLQTW